MYISRIYFKSFRNFIQFDQTFNKGCNLIVAPNGSGKTNILEAIQVLSLGKSLRATTQFDLIHHDNDHAFLKAKCETDTIDILIKKLNIGQRISKTYKRNEQSITPNAFSHQFITLWFSAESMNVINSSSSSKREFIDNFISGINKHYLANLKQYKEAIHQKNILLTKNDVIDKQKFLYLNNLLVKYGSQIIKIRSFYIEKIIQYIQLESLDRYSYKFDYLPSIECDPIFDEDIELKFYEKLNLYQQKEMISRRCLIGPHKDSWKLYFNTNKGLSIHDLGIFGSRGQKRIGILNMLICFLKIIKENTQFSPILLLDDITSELDEKNIKIVEWIVAQSKMQCFITTTSKDVFSSSFLETSNIINLLSPQDYHNIG